MRYLLLIALVVLSLPAISDPYVFDDGTYNFTANSADECEGKGRYSYDCRKYFDGMASNKLSASYNKLLSQLDRDKELFIKAQEQWILYSQTQCSFESAGSQAFANPQREYQLMYDRCMNNLAIERSQYLEKISVGCSGCVK